MGGSIVVRCKALSCASFRRPQTLRERIVYNPNHSAPMCLPLQYKWIVLSNTTIAILMASLDGTIVLISLPAIFNGLADRPPLLLPVPALDPLRVQPRDRHAARHLRADLGHLRQGEDVQPRVRRSSRSARSWGISPRTRGTRARSSSSSSGSSWASGAAFLFANGVAILTDAFPEKERGQALGINMVAVIAGSMLGPYPRGVLATIDWRLIFLVNVPIGVFATAWAYLKLKEVDKIRRKQKIDVWGNLTFGGGLTLLMVGVTYGLLPYGTLLLRLGQPVGDRVDVGGAGPPRRASSSSNEG